MNTAFLQHHAPFNQLQAEHFTFLSQNLTSSTFPRGSIITGPDHGPADKLYIIQQGSVGGFINRQTPLDDPVWELHVGESFPVGALLSQRPAHTWHRALEDSHCLALSREDFNELLRQSSVFHDFCTRRLANLLELAMRNMQAGSAASISEDSSLNTPLRNLLISDAICCLPDTPIGDALKQMEQAHRRSIAVVDAQQHPIGIVTLRDVLSRVTLPRESIDSPISKVMSATSECLTPDDFAYEAALIMARHGYGHVCITDNDRFAGLVSERDLFTLQRVSPGNLSRTIQQSENIETLKQYHLDIAALTDQMLAQGASVTQLTRLISTLNDLLTRQVIRICERLHGTPDIAYTWLAFGSEGRMEQTLKTDQDNGIIFNVHDQDIDASQQKLLPLAQSINQALAEVGFSLCPGNIMAGNPECCLSLSQWQKKFESWINTATPEHLLKASIFFDFRVIHGEEDSAAQLRQWLNELAVKNSRFRQFMATNALTHRPPLGLFKDFTGSGHKDHPNDIDLKNHGLTPFVDAARIIALANNIEQTNTISRLKQAVKKNAVLEQSAASWIEAYQYIQLLRMRNHRQQAREHRTLSNFLDPDSLNELERRILKESFRQARKIQTRLALDYQL